MRLEFHQMICFLQVPLLCPKSCAKSVLARGHPFKGYSASSTAIPHSPTRLTFWTLTNNSGKPTALLQKDPSTWRATSSGYVT